MTELRSQVNQARYQLLIALAGLERATACAYQPGFETAPTTDAAESDEKKKDKDEDKNDKDKNGEKLGNPKKGGNNDEKPGKPRGRDKEEPAASGPNL
jgi:hypothetical protein